MITLTKIKSQTSSVGNLNEQTGDTDYKFLNNSRTFLYIRNESGAARAITFDKNGVEPDGINYDDSTEYDLQTDNPSSHVFGPFPASKFNDSSGFLTFHVDTSTNVFVSVFTF